MALSGWNDVEWPEPDRVRIGWVGSALAIAEIAPAGTVRTINEVGRSLWGWGDGERLSNALRIGLSELESGRIEMLPSRPGGPPVMALRFEEAGGWLIVGAERDAVSPHGDASEFRTLIEHIPVCVTVLRPDGTVVFANAEAAALTGYDFSDIRDRRFWADAVHPEDRWKLLGAQRRASDGETASVVVRFLSRHRGPLLAEMHMVAMETEGGPLIECVAFDVTERSEVEEALFQSEALYRIFLEQSPIGMLHVDAAGTVTFENHQLRQIIGEGADDAWIGRGIRDLEGLDDRGKQLVGEMLEVGAAFRAETMTYRGNGAGFRQLELHGSPIRHPEGGIVGGVLMVEDRTEELRRRRELEIRSRYASAEAELRKAALSDERQQAFLGVAARILGEAAGADRVYLLMNNAADDCCTHRARWSRSDIPKPGPLVILHREEPVLSSLIDERTGLHAHARAANAAGHVLLDKTEAREAIWLPFFDDSRFGGFAVFERIDVSSDGAPLTWLDTERQLIEQLVRLFETLWSWMLAGSRYRHISTTIEDCLFTYTYDEDGERKYLFLTPQIESLTGYAADEIVGGLDDLGSWSDALVHEADQALVDDHDVSLRDGHESRVVYRVQHVDGSTRWMHERATPETDAMGDVVVSGILTDVSEQKAAEEVLTEAKQQAESANRLKSAFIATMSHEIRTPMGAVNGFAELLTRELADLEGEGVSLPPQVVEFLQAIRDNSKRILTLVNDLFDLSNLEVGSVELRRVRIPLHQIVMRSTSKIAVPLSRKGVDLRVELASEDPAVVGDPQRLEQVVDNLLSNAVKFTEEGSVSVRTRLEGGRVVLEVEDTGVGMSETHLRRLFEPFVQEDSRLNRRFEGSGLGLSLVKRLLDLMDGDIEVASRKGEGSTFTVRLPQEPPPGEPLR